MDIIIISDSLTTTACQGAIMLTSILAAALLIFHNQSMNLLYSTNKYLILYAQTINGHCIPIRAVCIHIPNLSPLFTVMSLLS